MARPRRGERVQFSTEARAELFGCAGVVVKVSRKNGKMHYSVKLDSGDYTELVKLGVKIGAGALIGVPGEWLEIIS